MHLPGERNRRGKQRAPRRLFVLEEPPSYTLCHQEAVLPLTKRAAGLTVETFWFLPDSPAQGSLAWLSGVGETDGRFSRALDESCIIHKGRKDCQGEHRPENGVRTLAHENKQRKSNNFENKCLKKIGKIK